VLCITGLRAVPEVENARLLGRPDHGTLANSFSQGAFFSSSVNGPRGPGRWYIVHGGIGTLIFSAFGHRFSGRPPIEAGRIVDDPFGSRHPVKTSALTRRKQKPLRCVKVPGRGPPYTFWRIPGRPNPIPASCPCPPNDL